MSHFTFGAHMDLILVKNLEITFSLLFLQHMNASKVKLFPITTTF